MKVLITDNLSPLAADMLRSAGIGVDIHLKQTPEQLAELAPSYDGWLIRSGTQITADLLDKAANLKAIGRAGVGVDNVDLTAATRHGVLVLNAPDGNTLSTAEHTCAMLLALSRHIARAATSTADGKWERKKFMGAEVYGKTLGVVGVGKIGRAVAKRMQAFGMRVVGFDPVLSTDVADRLGIELMDLDELFRQSDYLTFHTPLNTHTKGLLNATTLEGCKDGVRVVNCARGGIVDEADLLAALEAGKVAGAALDVYSSEPPPPELTALLAHPRVLATPHIAASTEEAQEKVAQQVTEQLINALQGRPVSTPVNSMAIRMAAQPEVQPYLRLAEKLGEVQGQLSGAAVGRVTVTCAGDLVQRYAEVIGVGVLKGLLSAWHNEPVNYINAKTFADDAGLRVESRQTSADGQFANLVEVDIETGRGTRTIAGAVFGDDDVRLVRFDGYQFEVRPEGTVLFYVNADRPGMLAAVGHELAQASINIGALSLGRHGGRGEPALT
ncbi:MAG: phosphoglycerate dehydrogenase, partial [Bacteroidota bacterium]